MSDTAASPQSLEALQESRAALSEAFTHHLERGREAIAFSEKALSAHPGFNTAPNSKSRVVAAEYATIALAHKAYMDVARAGVEDIDAVLAELEGSPESE